MVIPFYKCNGNNNKFIILLNSEIPEDFVGKHTDCSRILTFLNGLFVEHKWISIRFLTFLKICLSNTQNGSRILEFLETCFVKHKQKWLQNYEIPEDPVCKTQTRWLRSSVIPGHCVCKTQTQVPRFPEGFFLAHLEYDKIRMTE